MTQEEKSKLVIESVAYKGTKGDYQFKATYLTEPKGMALIEITKADKIVREFLFPSYKVWNIAAHAEDIISGLDEDSDSGLYMAGDTILGGNSFNP